MAKLKRYIDCYIGIETCNLRCHYCYITQKRLFNNKATSFRHSPQKIRQALSAERLGGTCLLNLCAGGETLLAKGLIEIVQELLEDGHYITLVTNGTLTKRFQNIAKLDRALLNRLFFKFSFHYLELLRTGKMHVFFDNVQLMKDVGASFTVEITPSDELIPHIQDVKRICMERLGVLCHVTIARDDRTTGIKVLSKHDFEKYKEIWGQFQSDLFDFKTTIFYKKRKEFCYAGDWSLYLNLNSGRLTQCYCGKEIGNIYRNISEPLQFEPIGRHCSLPHCYNGHAFLTLGTIPELGTPTYAEMRDRICENGQAWLQPAVRDFFMQKLMDNNKSYNASKKIKLEIRHLFYKFALRAHRYFMS